MDMLDHYYRRHLDREHTQTHTQIRAHVCAHIKSLSEKHAFRQWLRGRGPGGGGMKQLTKTKPTKRFHPLKQQRCHDTGLATQCS